MADTPDYVNGEPAPVPNGGASMHDLVCIDLRGHMLAHLRVSDMTKAQMLDYLRYRKAYGLNKHGTILQANNGRNSRQDALEEVVDLLVYLKQMTVEFPDDGYAVVAYAGAVSVYANIIKSMNVNGSVRYVVTP